MESSVKVFVALAPPLIWLLYFRERERFATPAGAVWLAVLCGVLVTFPAWLLQEFLRTFPDISFRWFQDLAVIRALTLNGKYAHEAVRGIIYGGVIEECLKLLTALALFGILRRRLRPWHMPVVVVAIGCGFAVVENMLTYFNKPDWQQAAWLRSFSGVHVFYGAVMGSFLALGFMRRAPLVMFPAALIVPMVLHGAFNHTIALNAAGGEVGRLARITFVAVVLVLGLLAVGLARHVAHLSETQAGDGVAPVHPWLRHRRVREWTWLFLAMLCGLLAIVFPFVIGRGADLLQFRETLVLGVFAMFSAILFTRRGREAAKAISAGRGRGANRDHATSGRLA